MPEKNRTYRARIEGYTSEGLGVARIDGQAVFVHRALRGEDCDVLILKVLKNAAFGKVVQVHEPSPHRREPDCPWYGRCGGCDFRHMDREEELYAKRQRVQDALTRLGVHRMFISLGAEGVYAAMGAQKLWLPNIPGQMVNTTGCGDAFMAALVWAYLEGSDLETTARAGLAAGSIAMESAETINPQMSALALKTRMNA